MRKSSAANPRATLLVMLSCMVVCASAYADSISKEMAMSWDILSFAQGLSYKGTQYRQVSEVIIIIIIIIIITIIIIIIIIKIIINK